MANFATKVAQIGSKWPILVNFQLFPGFPPKAAQIDLEWLISLIHNFSNLFPPKQLIFGQISNLP